MPLEILQTVSASLHSLDRKLSINIGLEKAVLIAKDGWMEMQLIHATHSISLGLLVILFISLGPSEKLDHEHITLLKLAPKTISKHLLPVSLTFFFSIVCSNC